MDTVDENQAFRSYLSTAVQKLRAQSDDKWKHKPVLAKTLERMRDYLEVLLSSPNNLMAENKRDARRILLDSLDCPDALYLDGTISSLLEAEEEAQPQLTPYVGIWAATRRPK